MTLHTLLPRSFMEFLLGSFVVSSTYPPFAFLSATWTWARRWKTEFAKIALCAFDVPTFCFPAFVEDAFTEQIC